MSIGFPSTANDFALSASSSTVAPPVNTANGDVLIAVAVNRNSDVASPGNGWTTLQSPFAGGSNGGGLVQYLPVPNAGSLPANWSWGGTTSRVNIIIFRVTGMNVSSPVFQVGTPVAAGSDGAPALPMVLPGITAGGGAVAVVFTFFTESAISADFVPGFTLAATNTTPTAGAGRSSMGVFTDLITGATGNITTANDWPGGGASGQDGMLLGFSPAGGAVTGPAYTASMSSM